MHYYRSFHAITVTVTVIFITFLLYKVLRFGTRHSEIGFGNVVNKVSGKVCIVCLERGFLRISKRIIDHTCTPVRIATTLNTPATSATTTYWRDIAITQHTTFVEHLWFAKFPY